MSARALEFVEEWVSDKIEAMIDHAPGDKSLAEELAAECVAAANAEGITQAEIAEAFDDLAEFINGQIAEARDRDEERAGGDGGGDGGDDE